MSFSKLLSKRNLETIDWDWLGSGSGMALQPGNNGIIGGELTPKSQMAEVLKIGHSVFNF